MPKGIDNDISGMSINDFTPEQIEKAKQKILQRREYDRKRNEQRRTEIHQQNTSYYQKNREKRIEQEKARYEKDIERKREYDRQHAPLYQQKHKAEISAAHHAHYEESKAKVLKQCCDYQKNHPEARIKSGRKRRALLFNADGNFTKDEFELKCKEANNRCTYCGKIRKLVPDHATPLTRGGSNLIQNIVPSCKSCNSRKNTKTYDEFMNQLKEESIRSITNDTERQKIHEHIS